MTAFELVWVLAVCGAGLLLRLWHIGTASLWWDEIVHIATAWQRDAYAVFRAAKLGIPPGFGNAGAVPVDYLLYHAYLRAVPMPQPEALEAYFRAPACAFSALTPLLLWLWARRAFNRGVALVTATLLAFSVPHVLYAVEARSYALFTCLTVVQFAAFAWLLEAPSLGRWIAFGIASVIYFLTGLLGLIVVAIMYALLLVRLGFQLLGRRAAYVAVRIDLIRLLGLGLAIAAVLYAYFLGTDLRAVAKGKVVASDPLGTTLSVFADYLSDRAILVGLLALSVPLLAASCSTVARRCHPLVVVALLLSVILVVPAVVELERHKQYYFHPRHALFVVPLACLAIALTLDVLAGRLGVLLAGSARRRRWLAIAIELTLILALVVPPAYAYVVAPLPFLARTKPLRNMKRVSQALRDLAATSAADEKILVLAESTGPGYLSNASLALYLRWYGLEDQVVLRGVGNPGMAMIRLRELCPDGCRGRDGQELTTALKTSEALGVPLDAQRLLGVTHGIGAWPGRVRSVVLVSYSPIQPGPWTAGFERRGYLGITTWTVAVPGRIS